METHGTSVMVHSHFTQVLRKQGRSKQIGIKPEGSQMPGNLKHGVKQKEKRKEGLKHD